MYSFQYVVWTLEDLAIQNLFGILAFALQLHVMTAIHEVGHAAVGALLGLRSTGIRIGSEKSRMFTIPFPGYGITLGWSPTSGHTYFVDEKNFPQTWQVLMTYLAGPLLVVLSGPVFFLLFRQTHFMVAAMLGAHLVFTGIYDLRKGCPDGREARKLWKYLRSARASMSTP